LPIGHGRCNYLSHLRPRGIPSFPAISEFPELNVRTYVTLGGKAGVYFFSLDAGSALAVEAARAIYRLPYYRADMNITPVSDGSFSYSSKRTDRGAPEAELMAHYKPIGSMKTAEKGSLDHFLTERYCLFAADSRASVFEAEIHHRPWLLRDAEAEFERNTMADAAGVSLPAQPPRLSFADQIDVVVWAPRRRN
jgi:uncharacterized protein YqjF (DUF2071 family)